MKAHDLTPIPHGHKTIARIAGQKWPRIMSIEMAAAYVGRPGGASFKAVPEYAALIKTRFGIQTVDKHELDEVLDKFLSTTIHL